MEVVKNEQFSKIYEVDCFRKEFMKVVDEKNTTNPPFPRYQKWLIGALTQLEEYGKDAVKLQTFEYLSNTSPRIYSIRYAKSKKNPRVIYAYVGEDSILLLGAFLEHNKSDYERNIKVAQKRLLQLME